MHLSQIIPHVDSCIARPSPLLVSDQNFRGQPPSGGEGDQAHAALLTNECSAAALGASSHISAALIHHPFHGSRSR